MLRPRSPLNPRTSPTHIRPHHYTVRTICTAAPMRLCQHEVCLRRHTIPAVSMIFCMLHSPWALCRIRIPMRPRADTRIPTPVPHVHRLGHAFLPHLHQALYPRPMAVRSGVVWEAVAARWTMPRCHLPWMCSRTMLLSSILPVPHTFTRMHPPMPRRIIAARIRAPTRRRPVGRGRQSLCHVPQPRPASHDRPVGAASTAQKSGCRTCVGPPRRTPSCVVPLKSMGSGGSM